MHSNRQHDKTKQNHMIVIRNLMSMRIQIEWVPKIGLCHIRLKNALLLTTISKNSEQSYKLGKKAYAAKTLHKIKGLRMRSNRRRNETKKSYGSHKKTNVKENTHLMVLKNRAMSH